VVISFPNEYRRDVTPPHPTAPAPTDRDGTDQLAVDLRAALLRTARRLRSMKSLDELSDAQFSVLAHVHVQGPLTPGELAEAEHVRPPSMTRTIAALVEAGLVQRTDHPTDRRQVLISVTGTGRTVVEETRRRRAQWLSRRLDQLTPAERATLADAVGILQRVIAE